METGTLVRAATRRGWRWSLRGGVAFFLASLAFAAESPSGAADAPGLPIVVSGPSASALVGPKERVAGRSYAQWVVAGWKYDISFLHTYRAAGPLTESCSTRGQRGPVWILGEDDYVDGPSSRVTCSLPAGSYVLVPGLGDMCTTVLPGTPLYAPTDAGLRRCAKHNWRGLETREELVLDGVHLSTRTALVLTPVFRFSMPARNNWLSAPGHTRGRAVVYGGARLLQPLAPGRHSLVVIFRFPREPHEPAQRLEYTLTVE